MSHTFDIHLSTDAVTGEVEITPYPTEDSHVPVDPGEWPTIREELQERVRDIIGDVDEWQVYLDSNRRGQRLDVTVGRAVLADDGEILTLKVWITDPEDVEW